MEFADRVALVTGAANGIGRATAVALAREGCDVVVSDIADPRGVVAEIQAEGRRTLAIHTDVAKRTEVEAMVEQAIDWQGQCDLYISNAGIGCRGAAHEFSVADWQKILDVDLLASVWAIRLLIPHMLERGTGRLSFVSSGAGLDGGSDRAPYCVAKFGMIGLAESLAKQLKGTGVSVSIIVPGAVNTTGWSRYLVARAAETPPGELDAQREARRDEAASWPAPEVMAAKIVDGLREDRLYIFQDNPWVTDWYGDLMQRRAKDPDGFVLG